MLQNDVLTLDPWQALFLFFKYNADLKQSICLSLSEFKNDKKTKSKKRTKPESIALNLLFGFVFGGGGRALRPFQL